MAHIFTTMAVMAENILVLVPRDFDAIPEDPALLLQTLRDERFIADSIEVNGEKHYRPGEEFMMLITFLGCSPMIASGEMDGGEQYCHIAIEGPLQQPQFLSGDNIKVPRCPKCGHRHDDWQVLIEQWREEPHGSFPCAGCGELISATELRWRKCAGFGRYFIKLWGIFESEAVPSPNLLAVLKKCSGIEWQHFYVRKN